MLDNAVAFTLTPWQPETAIANNIIKTIRIALSFIGTDVGLSFTVDGSLDAATKSMSLRTSDQRCDRVCCR